MGSEMCIRDSRAAHAHLHAGQTPTPLAQADHAELAHVQHAEEQAVQQQAKQQLEPPPYQRGPGRGGRKREKQPVQQRPHHVTAPYGKRVSLRASCGGVAARRWDVSFVLLLIGNSRYFGKRGQPRDHFQHAVVPQIAHGF